MPYILPLYTSWPIPFNLSDHTKSFPFPFGISYLNFSKLKVPSGLNQFEAYAPFVDPFKSLYRLAKDSASFSLVIKRCIQSLFQDIASRFSSGVYDPSIPSTSYNPFPADILSVDAASPLFYNSYCFVSGLYHLRYLFVFFKSSSV